MDELPDPITFVVPSGVNGDYVGMCPTCCKVDYETGTINFAYFDRHHETGSYGSRYECRQCTYFVYTEEPDQEDFLKWLEKWRCTDGGCMCRVTAHIGNYRHYILWYNECTPTKPCIEE